ncbi:MAG: hypothetical protein KatS3mg031_0675 [Chitinophagales bacterium]|nr:MAG: hypothetical protein KatS3mg031_0675 [Chitinophagales bacterium]
MGQCSNSFTITRTWTATDACGNSSSATQAITVTDDTPPVITGIGPDKSITCEEAVEFDQATAQDGCGGQVQLTYEDDTIAGQCANAYIIIRTWTATDACGNSSSATQAITVTDDTPPVITGVGADETISCPAIPQFSTPFAEDACSQAIITFIDDITFGNCLGEYSVTRVWIATDACGNTSTASQTITVVDADAPQLVYMPADDTLQCPDVTFDAPLYMDCTQITVSFEDDTIFEQAPEHVVFIRSFLATDACGNTSDTVKQRIVLINNRIPATGIHPSCTGTCDGSVAVGGDCYSYQWSTGDTTPVVNGLCDGIYIVTMTDAFGYAVTDTVVLVAPDPIILAAEVQQVSCYGASDGAATVIAGGGTPPYTFLWSFGATTQHVSGLLFGSYIVTVSDSHGCSDTLVVEIPQPDPLELGAIAVPASCYNGSDGMITLTVAGGSSPYSFLWSTGDTTQNVEGLSAGVYSVTVTDARQCEAVVSAEVLQPDPIILSALLQDAGCPGEDAGAIDLTVSGGTGPYSYGWSNGATTEDLSGLSAGVYSVTVTDIYGCTTEGTYELLGYPGFDLEFDTIHTSCPSGQQLCKLDFAGFPHGYILNGEEYASDGIHITWVAYPNTWTNTPNINQLIIFDTYKTGTPDPDLEVGIGNIAIFPENLTDANGDGLVDVPNDTRWGGQQIYTFDFPRTVISVVIVDHDRPGGSIKAYDAFNNLIVSVPLPIIPNGGVATIPINASGVSKLVIDDDDSGGTSDIIFACDSVCCDGSASVLVSGGTPPFSYLWSNGDTTATADSLCAGIYTVTVTDANGCTRVDSIEIVAGQQQSAFRMMQDEFENFTAYPVPFDDVLFMHYLAREEGETQIRIFDMLGQVVYQRKMYAQEGVNRVALHFGETLADGVYILELRKKDYAEYKKLNKNY